MHGRLSGSLSLSVNALFVNARKFDGSKFVLLGVDVPAKNRAAAEQENADLAVMPRASRVIANHFASLMHRVDGMERVGTCWNM